MRPCMWVHNFARPVFFKTNEIKSSKGEFFIHPYRGYASTTFHTSICFSQYNNYEMEAYDIYHINEGYFDSSLFKLFTKK